MPKSFRVRASLVVGSALLLLRLTTAAVFGSIDCALQFHSASSTTPPRRFGAAPCLRDTSALLRLVALHCIYGYKLSLTATFPLSPPPLLRRGVGTLHSAVNPATSACFSDSQGQAYALRPPVGALPPSATILPPGRGLMNAR